MLIFKKIYNEEAYDEAVLVLNSLLDITGDDEAHPLITTVDAMGNLISEYEKIHYPI